MCFDIYHICPYGVVEDHKEHCPFIRTQHCGLMADPELAAGGTVDNPGPGANEYPYTVIVCKVVGWYQVRRCYPCSLKYGTDDGWSTTATNPYSKCCKPLLTREWLIAAVWGVKVKVIAWLHSVH